MATLPTPDNTFYERLGVWHQMKQQLAELKQKEALLRRDLFGEAFPKAEEGTTYFPLNAGWRLKGIPKINRTVEVIHLGQMRDELAARFGVAIDPLLKWSCGLDMKNYKALDENVRVFFDNIITAQPGMPDLELVAPKDEDVGLTAETAQEVTQADPRSAAEITVKPKRTRKKKAAE